MRPGSLLAASLSILCVATAVAQTETDPLPLRTRHLTRHVLVLTEISPWESNHVVIDTAKGLVLVDPGHSPTVARLLRAATKAELGRDRFAYVVDHHDHWGHSWGNCAFPEALVVGHEQAARFMRLGAGQVAGRLTFMRRLAGKARARLAGLDPGSEEAAAAGVEVAHLDRIVAGLSEPGFSVRPPDLTFSDRLTLDLGNVTLRMLYLGHGHSASDIVVFIPEDRVLLLGCFFFIRDGLPHVGSAPRLDVDRWLEVLGAVLDGPDPVEHVVIGQHEIWPRERLAGMRDYLAWLWPAVQRAEAEDLHLKDTIHSLPAGERLAFLRQSAGDDEALGEYHQEVVRALWGQLKPSAATVISEAMASGGADEARTRYAEIEAAPAGDFIVDEAALNLLGYRLLGEGRVDQAIAVFEINAEAFPDSWNVYDSLGEAWLAAGDAERAAELYRRSLEINPGNANGRAALERIEAMAPEQ